MTWGRNKSEDWTRTKCVLCGKVDDRDMGIVYRYKDAKYHFNCVIDRLLELSREIEK